MEVAIHFLGAGAAVWALTYMTNRLWLGFKSFTGGF